MKILRQLYVWVLFAIFAGALFGHYFPERAVAFKPLGDGFVSLVKMLIGPIIFCTIVTGIGRIGDLKKVGRVGIKALVYFEAVTTVALIIGFVVVNWIQPGAGRHAVVTAAEVSKAATFNKPLVQSDFCSTSSPPRFREH